MACSRFWAQGLVLALSAVGSTVQAAPIQWTLASGGNGHWYEYVSLPGGTWESARDAAAALTHQGQQGYLATITSADETAFLNVLNGGQGWVGATDRAVEGTWVWDTGPEAGTVFWKDGVTQTYATWNGGEPNNAGNEDYLVIKQLAGWNDAPTGYAQAYYVEFSSPVPEPASLVLMLAGLAAAGGLSRRR